MQASSSPPDILARIVETKRDEVGRLRPRAAELRDRARDLPPTRDFTAALAGGDTVSVIAEVKRRSPGAGEIRPLLDPGRLAETYRRSGAAALSVLTDREYFGGSLDDLAAARTASGLPALRKDFTIDPLHVVEARAHGADAVLLIVRILPQGLLEELLGLAAELGLAALVEVHDGPELARAVEAGARIVGINNRDLATFDTDLAVTEGLVDRLPDDAVTVSESGIRGGADVARVGRAGVDAVLVGEAILREPEPGLKVGELAGHPVLTRTG
jgi:indole-3-glycerol phosphate synthase